MNRNIIISQPFGFGDLVFCISLAHYLAKGRNILWPVLPALVKDVSTAYPNISFMDKEFFNISLETKYEYSTNSYSYYPIRFAESILNLSYEHCMSAKYTLYGLDYKTKWKEQAMWIRNPSRERYLFDVLKISLEEKYNLINRNFGVDGFYKAVIEPPNNGCRNVDMSMIPGFSLFDWSMVMEHATEIHTVSTSLLYMMEMLPLQCPMHLYTRKPLEIDFRNVFYLFSRNYILHQ